MSEAEPRVERAVDLRPSPTALALLLLHALLVVWSAWEGPVTTDENNYFNGGRLILTEGFVHDYALYQGPVPLAANQLFAPENAGQNLREDRVLKLRARLGTLPFALLSAALVYLWARHLFGERGALLALLLHALSPLMIGYGALVAVDGHHAAVVLLTLFLLWRALETGSGRTLVLTGVALGVALGTKYLVVLLVPPVLLAVTWRAARGESGTVRLRRAVGAVAAVGLTALVVLHGCYGFSGGLALQPVEALRSEQVRSLLATPVVGWLMRLLPAHFVHGLDVQMDLIRDHWVFLDGRFAPGHADFYLRALAYKTPEVTLLVLVLAVGVIVRGRLRGGRPSPAARSTLIAVVPYVLVAGTYMSLSSRQAGVRYALPFLPPLFLLAGALGPLLCTRARLVGALGLVAGLHAIDLARGRPDWIAYYSTAAGGRLHAWRHLRDSSSDFGQYEFDGAARMRARDDHPLTLDGLAGARFGRIAVDDDALRAQDPEDRTRPRMDWVTACVLVPPSLSASWWVFDVTPEALEQAVARSDDERLRRDLALAYLGAGRRPEAEAHLARLEPALAEPLRRVVALEDQAAARPELGSLETLARAWRAVGRPDLVTGLMERHPALRESRVAGLIEVRALEESLRFEEALARLEPLIEGYDDPAQITRLRLMRRAQHPVQACHAFLELDRALGGVSARAPEVYREFREDMLRRCQVDGSGDR
jgi:4-amino-4-deoxy-L-arabinose transferase-like glycosyltransferase